MVLDQGANSIFYSISRCFCLQRFLQVLCGRGVVNLTWCIRGRILEFDGVVDLPSAAHNSPRVLSSRSGVLEFWLGAQRERAPITVVKQRAPILVINELANRSSKPGTNCINVSQLQF